MKKLRAIFKSLKLVQNLWQVRIERKKFLNIKKKIIIIQRWIKNKICKNSISDQRKNIILIQKYIRRYLASRYDHKEIAAKIIKLQRNFKNRIEKMKTIRYKAIKQIFLVIF